MVLYKKKRYKLLLLALFFFISAEHSFIVSGYFITYGHECYPFSKWALCLSSLLMVPLFYWVTNSAAGRPKPIKSLLVLFAPVCLLSLAGLAVRIGRDVTELIVFCQAILLIGSTCLDYRQIRGDAQLVKDVNTLMNYGGLFGLSLSVQAVVGFSNWMTLREYATVFFCLNSFVLSYVCFLLKKLVIRRSVIAQAPVMEVVLPTAEPHRPAIPTVDYAGLPEIPREDEELACSLMLTPPEPSQKDVLVANLRKLVEQDHIYLRAGLRIDEVALLLGTNRTYIAKLMKDIYGHPFSEYMNLCRLKSAQNDMLARKNASIESIALANGFNSSNTFNKVFNQYNGCSPAVWRRETLEEKVG